MRLAIVGSRSLTSITAYEIAAEVRKHFDINEISLVVSGGAMGVDRAATDWAHREAYIPFLVIPPNYNKYPGWKAPKERNTQIAEFADECLAIQRGNSGGTQDTIDKFLACGKRVVVVKR